MAWTTDSLRSAIAALNPFRSGAEAPAIATPQLALAAYMASGLLRKVIAIPAEDRVREWRDWQAEADAIAAIEAEERRLGLQAKVRFAEVLRGVGGGALILVTAGDHSKPLDPDAVAEKGLVAISVVSRWQIQGQDWVRDLADPAYGTPRMWSIAASPRDQRMIHPSRVICFRGDPLPDGGAMPLSEEDQFWGDSRLMRVFREVQKADNAHRWFSELVKKAKLLRIGIPDLDSMDEDRVNRRVALIAEGEGILNATVYRSSSTRDDAGEKIDDYQVSWAGIPAVMDAFDQRVAAVADIPFTRLMGRSPAGMNATGEHDQDNWNKMVVAGQNLETRPCLEALDPILIRSAGVDPTDVTWAFAPLDVPSEKELAETFKTAMEAISKVQDTGAVPEEAFAKGLQNWLIEREYLPGLDQALADIPEDERYGIEPEPQADPEAVANMLASGAITQQQADALVMDAAPRSLYVSRPVVNAAEIRAWAKAQGLPELQPDLHVTIAASRKPVDWMKIESEDWNQDRDGTIEIPPGGVRLVEPLGDRTAVLLFTSSRLSWRHEQIVRAGASWDFEEYQPHISLTGDPVDLAGVEPYRGRIVLGPEKFEEVKQDEA
jgi:phage-related protein (TIGR01555 family)